MSVKNTVVNYAILFAIAQEVSNRVANNRDMNLNTDRRDVSVVNKLISKTSSVLEEK